MKKHKLFVIRSNYTVLDGRRVKAISIVDAAALAGIMLENERLDINLYTPGYSGGSAIIESVTFDGYYYE